MWQLAPGTEIRWQGEYGDNGPAPALGISLFGKNWNLFTATKIWASMTKIGRSMG